VKKTTADLRAGKPGRDEFQRLRRRPLTLVLSGLKMENLGSVFRVADAALIERIVLCGVPYTPDSLRFKKASKGTQRWVPHEVRGDLVQTVKELKSRGVHIYALEQAAGSVPYHRAPYRFPAALVLGKEREGLDERVVEMADGILEIPMRGMSNSLNVAVACGIVVYHVVTVLETDLEKDRTDLR
jgi:tRNA G18 (ribose-2'-O)-methylase SpoU